MRLPFESESVGAITVGYGLWNLPELSGGVREMARVLRLGGRLFSLDFYCPANALWSSLYLSYLSVAGATYGWLWHRDANVYAHIARSIRHFVSAYEYCAVLEDKGLWVVEVKRKLLGGICLQLGRNRSNRFLTPPIPVLDSLRLWLGASFSRSRRRKSAPNAAAR